MKTCDLEIGEIYCLENPKEAIFFVLDIKQDLTRRISYVTFLVGKAIFTNIYSTNEELIFCKIGG